jgi:hypothetical protein
VQRANWSLTLTGEACQLVSNTNGCSVPTGLLHERVQRGRAMAQAVSRRPPTAEAWVRSRVSPCGICGGQSGTGTGFSPEYFVFPLSISFHRCSITWKNEKELIIFHLNQRVAQEALRLRCIRSICCGALHKKGAAWQLVSRSNECSVAIRLSH